MAEYPDLYRRLAREILKHEGRIDGDARQFVARLDDQLRAEGRQITPAVQAELADYLTAMQAGIQAGIVNAVALAATAAPRSLQSAAVARMAEQAFSERWPDGLTLSERLWNWQASVRTGLTQTLNDSIRHGESVNKILYKMQRTIERAPGGRPFQIVETYADDWVKELYESAVAMIHDPDASELWKAAVGEAEERILSLKPTGTRSAAERVLSQIQKAVSKGAEELADRAVKWWLYDKQLYHLKRIARTEMATALHRAVIAGSEQDETIIGYQWRLSASHPATDICDYYASIDMGLGKGVWTKDAVPKHKAHPHCMCLLIPRVTPLRQQGDTNYAEFIRNSPPERREQLLPKWVKNLHGLGMPLDRLIRPDGLGLVTRQALKERKGEAAFNALTALGKAAHEAKWPSNKIRPNNKMSRPVMDALQANRDKTEVDKFLNELETNRFNVNSLEWHYFKYKYYYGEPLAGKATFNRRFDPVFQDLSTQVYRPGERYVLYSASLDRLAYVSPDGLRISIYQPAADELEHLGKPLWTIQDLIN